MTELSELPKAAEKVVPLLPHRIKPSANRAVDMTAVVEAGTKFETVLKPEFWSTASRLLMPMQVLRVYPDDGLWYAEVIVTEVSRNWARVHELRYKPLTTPDVAMTQAAEAKFRVEWRGPHLKWCIERIADGKRMKEEIQSKPAALQDRDQMERTAL